MQPRKQSSSVCQIGRAKSKRRFGTDLTNLQLCNNPKQIFAFTSLIMEPNNQNFVSNKTPFISQATSTTSQSREPLEDYLQDIKKYITDQTLYYFLDQDYLRWHSQINAEIRQALVRWIIKVQGQLSLKQSTLYLAIKLLDSYCYKRNITKNKYQLLGICCLFMSAKYQQITTPRMSSYLELCGTRYSKKDMTTMEGQVLQSICFEINKIVTTRQLTLIRLEETFKGIVDYNSLKQNQGQTKLNVEILCQYVLELALIQYDFCILPPNYLSAALLYISCKMKNVKGVNSKKIISHYGLNQDIFKTYFFKVITLYKSRNDPKFKEVNKKYNITDNYI